MAHAWAAKRFRAQGAWPALSRLARHARGIRSGTMTWVLPEKYEEGLLDEKGEPLSKR